MKYSRLGEQRVQGSEMTASWKCLRNENDRKGRFSTSVEVKVSGVGEGVRTRLGLGPGCLGQCKRFGFCS